MAAQMWMRPSGWGVAPPYLAVFRNRFEVTVPGVVRFTYSADERVGFFCDGEAIADGPPRGTPQRWFLSTVEIPVAPGKHVLTARLLAFGAGLTARGQMSVMPGLLVNDESGLLSAEWEYQLCMGCSFVSSNTDWGSYAHILTDESFNWHALTGDGGQWRKPEYVNSPRPLVKSELPPMRSEEVCNFRRSGPYFFFDDYVCVYGEYRFSGTGEVRLRWAEPGCDAETPPPGFAEQSKPGEPYPCFSGSGDRFRLTGGEVCWRDYWWHAGRTLEMTLYGDVKLESARFFQTGYPWKLRRSLEVPGNERMTRLLRRSWATLQACSFETLMDCPYYEQLQYISDSRFDLLVFYCLTESIFTFVGIPFTTTTYILAAATLVAVPGMAQLVRYLVPEKDLRLEIHFLVSLFVCILGLLTTVNGKTVYAAADEPVNWDAVILALSLFVGLFIIGFAWNRVKYPLIQKLTERKNKQQTNK